MGWSARVDKGAYGCIRVGGESFFTYVERVTAFGFGTILGVGIFL